MAYRLYPFFSYCTSRETFNLIVALQASLEYNFNIYGNRKELHKLFSVQPNVHAVTYDLHTLVTNTAVTGRGRRRVYI